MYGILRLFKYVKNNRKQQRSRELRVKSIFTWIYTNHKDTVPATQHKEDVKNHEDTYFINHEEATNRTTDRPARWDTCVILYIIQKSSQNMIAINKNNK